MSISQEKWTVLCSFYASRITSFLLFTIRVPYSLSTAAFASGVVIAWSMGTNVRTKLKWPNELNPFFAMWSSWSFGRVDSNRFLVDSWVPTMHARCVLRILLDPLVSLSVSSSLLGRFVVLSLQGIVASIRISYVSVRFSDGFLVLSIIRIDKINASHFPCIVKLRFIDIPLLRFLSSSCCWHGGRGHKWSGLTVAWIVVRRLPDDKHYFREISCSAFLRRHVSINAAKWTLHLSLCASILFLTLSNSQARIVSSFFHSLSTTAFASGIFIAWAQE